MMLGSLFSGIGGLELGVLSAMKTLGIPAEVAWQCEKDPYARAVLRKHWPATPCFEDVHDVDANAPPPLTSSSAASLAKTSLPLEGERGSAENALDYGSRMSGSFAFYDRGSSSWRTSQVCLIISDKFLVRWPSSGSMRNGVCSVRPRLERPIYEKGSSSLPTPKASDLDVGAPLRASRSRGKGPDRKRGADLRDHAAANFWPTPTVDGNNNRPSPGTKSGFGLATLARRFPTPTAMDAVSGPGTSPNRQGGMNLRTAVPAQSGGALNPTWVEWLMGLPLGWTDVDDVHASVALGMVSSRKRPSSRS